VSSAPPATCEACGLARELRPYGQNGAWWCFACAMKTPARRAETEQRMREALAGAGPVPVIRFGRAPIALAELPADELANVVIVASDAVGVLVGDEERSALERYGDQQAEWQAIANEMIADGKTPTAYQVSLEQRKRMLARGERPITADEIIDEVSKCGR
jgi:hypothetical protein